MEREESCKLSGAPSRPLRLEVPKRAIDRVAGSAGGKKCAEGRPVCAGGNCAGAARACRTPFSAGLAIPRGGPPSATPAVPAVPPGGAHPPPLVLRPPRDGETASDRPSLHLDGETKPPAGLRLVNLALRRSHTAFLSPGFSFKNRELPISSNLARQFKLSRSMLKRDHQVVLPTQARAPGFRVELRGTTFRLIATGACTVA